MHKIKKIFIVLMITFFTFNIFTISNAAGKKSESVSSGKKTTTSSSSTSSSSSTFNPSDYEPDEVSNTEAKSVFTKTGVILGAVRNISAVTAVIVLMVIGLKYMIGSAEEKANYKQTMVPYIIGCVLAVSGIAIVDFIYNSIH